MLSVRQAAAILKISERHVLRLISSQKLSGRKLNPEAKTSSYMITQQSLDDYLASKKKATS